MHSYTYLMVVHFDWYGVDTFANMTRQISIIPWLICDVQVVVAMVTRSVISSSEQFSAVQHVEMMTILFFAYNLLRHFRLVLTLKPYIAER